MTDKSKDPSAEVPFCMRRRDFLVAGAAGATIAAVHPRIAFAGTANNYSANEYPRAPLIKLSELKTGEPVAFNYPLEDQPNMIVKLGEPAQGGVGPDKDIVAFSVLCTHMGGSLRGRYRHDSKAMGPCPFHFSTFDLTKGGTPVHASATQNLPQVKLNVEGDQIYAEGMNGLIYGYRDNLIDGNPVIQKA
jgi:arsenite oxidase small subunit